MDELDEADDYEKQLERVLNEYPRKDSADKNNLKHDSKYIFKKETLNTKQSNVMFDSGTKEK
jgi:hypothetical protein